MLLKSAISNTAAQFPHFPTFPNTKILPPNPSFTVLASFKAKFVHNIKKVIIIPLLCIISVFFEFL